MYNLRKPLGFWLHLRQLLCLILSTGMVLIGAPVTVGASGPITKVTLFPGGPKGGPRGLNPGARFNIEPIAYNAEGAVEKCTGGWDVYVDNPFTGNVIKVYDMGNSVYQVVMTNVRGPAQVVASCKGNPEIKARMLVTGNGGKGPFEPTEIRSWLENPPPPLRFSQSQRRYLQAQAQKAPPPPVKRAPPEKAAGSGAGGAVLIGLLVGVAVLGAVALMSMGTAEKCPEGKAPCRNYDVCCPDLWYYCPATNKCFRVMSGYDCPGGAVACHN